MPSKLKHNAPHVSQRFTLSSFQWDVVWGTVLTLLVLFTLRHLFPTGLYYAHDTFSHFIRLFHFSNELVTGQFPVRWSHDLAYEYGYPTFNFTYVLPYYLASILHVLGASLGNSIKLIMIAASILSTVGWYIWLRVYFRPLPSFIGAALGWLAPYRFLMVFVTGQLGTIMAWAWIPVLFIGMHLLWEKQKTTHTSWLGGVVLLSVSVFGLITSHLLTAILLIPLVVGYFVFLVVSKRPFKIVQQRRKVLSLCLAAALGLGMAAFYWLPAFLELPFVKAGHVEIVPYREHFVFLKQLLYSPWGYGFSSPGAVDGISFQLGLAQWAATGMAGIIFAWWLFRRTQKKHIPKLHTFLAILGCVFCVYVFFMLPYSSFAWDHIPLLSSVQHPWRLLLAVVLIASVCGAFVTEKFRFGTLFGISVLMLAGFNTRNYMRPMELEYYSDEELEHRVELSKSGDVAWEFLPVSAKEPHFSPEIPVEFSAPDTQFLETGRDSYRFTVRDAESVTFNRFAFPGWKMWVNSVPVPITAGEDGRIVLELKSGEHTVELRYTETRIQQIGDLISVISVLGLAGIIAGSALRKRKADL